MASLECDGPTNQQFVKEINYDEIQKLQVVGEGSFGVVYKGKWKGKDVAVKNITTESERKAFGVEVRQLSRVNHENIVTLYGACTKGPNICLVMEYAEGGSLYNVLHCAPRVHYHIAHAMSWCFQCAKGVAYLHAMKPKPLIHRDLKPPNLLLIMDGRKLKICDFGTAADKSTYMTNSKGSAAWMAPEVFTSNNYTEKCDVYSWGIILWEVLSRQQPFKHIGGSAFGIMWQVNKGTRPPLLRNLPPPIENLMVRCWDQDPSIRPSMQEVVEIMTKISIVFPGGDQPVSYSDEDDNLYIDDDYEDEEEEEENQYFDEAQDNYSNTRNTITLPQPTEAMITPLSIEVDPHAWEKEYEDMELQTMPGFDKMVARNGSTNTIQTGIQSSPLSEGPCQTDPNLDNMYLLLDPHLRPASPDPTEPQSLELFEEHKQLAQEYLKVQTEIAYLSQRKKKLQEERSVEQLKKPSIQQLQSEKESLLLLKKTLEKQSELLNSNCPCRQGENWVFVPRHDQDS